MATEQKICGRRYDVRARTPNGPVRVIVDGINHPKGEPIRFKSAERAERHIRNMRLEVREAV